MAHWKNKVHVQGIWQLMREDEISYAEGAQRASVEVRKVMTDQLDEHDLDQLEDILDNWETGSEDADGFNYWYDQLCNWADWDNRLWIGTR